ncbi:MAG: LicD family protein [Arcobacteraceae bacterium]|nr:LicD family protein [Arcobacteraceae bacterium]
MANRTFYIKKNRDDVIKLLAILVKILDKYDVKYYLDFGTLIGAIRDKGLIPWDDDIDISLLNEADYSKIPNILKEIEKEYKYRTYLFTFKSANKKRIQRNRTIYQEKVSFTDNNNFQIAKIRTNKFWIFGRGNSCIDIFFKYTYNNKSCWLAYGQENSVPLKYMSKDLIDIDFCGLKCKIPEDYDKYLTYKYGDWKVPNEHWTHEDNDFSID